MNQVKQCCFCDAVGHDSKDCGFQQWAEKNLGKVEDAYHPETRKKMWDIAQSAWQAARAKHVDAIDTLSERVEKHCENRHDCQPAGEAVARVVIRTLRSGEEDEEFDLDIVPIKVDFLANGDLLYNAPPAQIPAFVRKRIERAIQEAVKPKGMSVHDGMARVPACDLQILLNGTVHTPEQHVQVTDSDGERRIANLLNIFSKQFGKNNDAEGLLEFYGRTHYEQGVEDGSRNTPYGWQLVPSEPTAEMLKVIDQHGEYYSDESLKDAYNDMLSSAPQPKGVSNG